MKDYEIFISHSTRDSELVTKLVEAIEAAGYRCWVSPRDIRAGIPYAHAIMEGLDACKVFVVVLTDNSVKSKHVLNEIDNAQNTGKHIIPLRRRDDGLELPGEFKYYLSRTQHVFTDGNNFTGIIAKMGLAPKQPQAPVEKPQQQTDLLVEKVRKGIELIDSEKYESAFPLLHEAAQMGNPEAMVGLGKIYVHRSDLEEARNWVVKAAEAGYEPSYYYLSELYWMLSITALKGSAAAKEFDLQRNRWVKKAAEAGNAYAQYIMGNLSISKHDSELALRWYQKAIENGNLDAKISMAHICYSGVVGDNVGTVPKNYALAAEYFIDFIDSGKGTLSQISSAECDLGCIYKNGGFGVVADKKKAKNYFERAVLYGDDDRNERAALELGKIFLNGEGCERNLVKAAKWLKKASESYSSYIKDEAQKIINSNLKLRILAMLK